jgi:DNA-binding Lrp family transcriptional regulator
VAALADKGTLLEEHDRIILTQLQQDAKVKLQSLVDQLGISRSSVHYRIRKLRDSGIIRGFYAAVDPKRAGYDINTISLIRVSHRHAAAGLGERLGDISGVWAVYKLLGEVDFAILSRAKNREDLQRILDEVRGIEGVERCNTYLVLDSLKEDPRVEL